MKIIFMGSPEEVVSPLRTLMEHCRSHDKDELLGVVSQPARPAGRKQVLTDPPVAAFAKEQGLTVWQPEKASAAEFLDVLRQAAPDVIITAAYGQILSENFLKIPQRATINIHPSALPAYRGATPVPAALLDGLTETAVTILFTVKALDAGNIIVQERFSIDPREYAGSLTDRLFAASGPLLLQALDKLRDPSFIGTPQDPSAVTFCKKIAKTDGQIAWGQPVDKLVNEFRAYKPWPGSFCFWQDARVVIEDMEPVAGDVPQLEPGAFRLDRKAKALLVGTGTRPLWIRQLKPAGSKSLDAMSFWNGARIQDEGRFH
jgi:methionyl-tRNA formyltransferase